MLRPSTGRVRRSITVSFDGPLKGCGSISSVLWLWQAARPHRFSSTVRPSKRIAAPLAAKGGSNQAIGRSRGGRTTKIHALTDGECRPIALMITGGQVADCTAGELLLEQMPHAPILHGDKGYDSNAIRRRVEGKGVMPNIPPKANRRWKNCFSPFLYRNRNAIERTFCRLKDFRRIATRYDRLATNYLAAVCLAAAVSYWL